MPVPPVMPLVPVVDPTQLEQSLHPRAPSPPRDPGFALFRDRETGFVSLLYVTARALVAEHPRADSRFLDDEPAALAALAALGRPPVVYSL